MSREGKSVMAAPRRSVLDIERRVRCPVLNWHLAVMCSRTKRMIPQTYKSNDNKVICTSIRNVLVYPSQYDLGYECSVYPALCVR